MKKRRVVAGIIIIAIVVGVVISGGKLVSMLQRYAQEKAAYDALAEDAVQSNELSDTAAIQIEENQSAKASDEAIEPVKPVLDITIDFQTLQEQNQDIVGWLYSPGTPINYPIVKGSDNEYYLNHDFQGQVSSSGCLFLDMENAGDFTDGNSLVYGHHMKNGTMLASLMKYQEQEYYEMHPVIFLLTPEKNYEITLFAAFTTPATSQVYTRDFADENAFLSWYYECMQKNQFDTEVTASYGNPILTLSTCEYSYNDARFVVMGKLQEM